jgi:hypothetical protein
MKLISEFVELLHKDGRTEMYKGTKDTFSWIPFSKSGTHTVNVYCCRLLLTKRQSVSYFQRLTVQHIYCTNTVQTVQSTTEINLQ